LGIEQWNTQEKAGKGSPQTCSSHMQQLNALAQENAQGNGPSAGANDSTKERKACNPFCCHKQGKQKKCSSQHLKPKSKNIPASSQEPRQAFPFRKKVLQNREAAETVKCCRTTWIRRANIT